MLLPSHTCAVLGLGPFCAVRRALAQTADLRRACPFGTCSRADPSGALRLWDVHPGRASDDVRGTLLLAVLMARTWVMSLSALRGAHHLRNSIQTTLGLS